jgi:hypothetical protein
MLAQKKLGNNIANAPTSYQNGSPNRCHIDETIEVASRIRFGSTLARPTAPKGDREHPAFSICTVFCFENNQKCNLRFIQQEMTNSIDNYAKGLWNRWK